MKKALHPAVIAGVAILAVVVLGYFAFKIGSGAPAEGNESTLPPQMKAAYGIGNSAGNSSSNASANAPQ